MAIVSITSNEGALEPTSAVLEVTATNPEYNQPALHIKQASKRGGANQWFNNERFQWKISTRRHWTLRTIISCSAPIIKIDFLI